MAAGGAGESQQHSGMSSWSCWDVAVELWGFGCSVAVLRKLVGPLLWEHTPHSFPTVDVCIHNKNDTVSMFEGHTQIEGCYLSSEPKVFGSFRFAFPWESEEDEADDVSREAQLHWRGLSP